MLAIHTILHPTDFSEPSGRALELACALARDYGARLVLLHVAPLPEVYGESLLVPSVWDNGAELKEKLQGLAAPHAGLRVEHHFARGDAVTEILQVAQDERVDLVVMGTHGRTGLDRLLMGSVAEQVVRQAPCPVLTVKVPRSDVKPPSEPPAEESRGAADEPADSASERGGELPRTEKQATPAQQAR
jgi:nucleotide-binding universal stress UspA family protein